MDTESETFFKLIEYLAAALVGGLATVAGAAAGGALSTLGMGVSMVAGMFAGMAAMGLVVFPFSLLVGIFELIMPGMIIGMMAGMAGAMGAGASMAKLLMWGAVAGVVVQVIFHLYDMTLHGETMPPEGD